MKIAVMGAGAVGCYYGGMLARAGHEVVLIGRPAHVEAIRTQGLRFEAAAFSGVITLAAASDASAIAGAALVLCCVKSGDSERAGAAMAPHLGATTTVLSLQNGVDNAARLSACLGRKVQPVAVYVAAEMAGPGHVRHHGRGDLVIGASTEAESLSTLFTAAGVPVRVSADVMATLWEKLIVNCALNALSAITRQPYGVLAQGAGVAEVIDDVLDECLAVARADGITIAADSRAAVQGIIDTMPTQRSSTAQDLMRGKPSEIDHLNGYVVRRGQALGIATPANRVLHALVRLLEKVPADA
ncbi:2-dehydropantoate 2-reductase [uncultured Propionivibrio sp.]|uniref:ketopantoate reductase family protein n=1 Tax=uncultured Propionivibrio sp. TaxID=426737 RepID=UPI0029C08025|nr:2-dehydropantoate 2-reductase [uncultured Propionivibrio sp.]